MTLYDVVVSSKIALEFIRRATDVTRSSPPTSPRPDSLSADQVWKSLAPFEGLSDTAWASIAPLLQTRRVEADAPIVHLGDPAREAFVLLRGAADVRDGGVGKKLATLGPGTLFGEQGLLTCGQRGADVVATESCELLVISAQAFDVIARERPEWLARLVERGAKQAEASIATGHALRQLFERAEGEGIERRSFSSGEALVTYGAEADGVYRLTAGEVEVLGASGQRLDVLGVGACVGELGVLLSLPRSATVVARTACEADWMPADVFREHLRDDPLTEQVLRKLWHGYRFERAFVRALETRGEAGPHRRTVYSLIDGRTVAVFRPGEASGFWADVAAGGAAGEARTVSWGGSARAPWLTLRLVDGDDGAHVVGMRASLNRPECSAAFHHLLDDTCITAEMEEHFVALGTLGPSGEDADPERDVLCRCMRVQRCDVEAAIASGARTLSAVRQATGCGGVCGACRVRVQAMISNADDPSETHAEAARGVDADIHVHALSRWAGRMGRTWAIGLGLWRYARPSVAMLGLALLPVLAFIAPRAAWVIAGVTALIVISDVLDARRQWRETFAHLAGPPVGIQPDEERPPGFAEDGARAIRGIVMRTLPFSDWMLYKYSLRQVYIANSVGRWLRHQVRIRALRMGFEGARTWSRRAQPFWGDVPREIAELCLETSLCLGMIHVSERADGTRVGVFRFTDWLSPAAMRDGREVGAVETFEVHVDLCARIALESSLNGRPLGATHDALCWTYMALSAYQHTMLHAYANWAAEPRHADPYVRQGARWTLSTNAVAIYSGNAFQSDARTFQKVVRHNASKSMFRHGTGPMMETISRHSHYARFMLEARRVFMEVMREQAVDVDLESLFLMTVVHSLDHHMAAVSVDPADLVTDDGRFHPAENVRVMFTEPLEPLGVNTRLCSFRRGWPKALYEALRAIDPELARYVDVGVSY